MEYYRYLINLMELLKIFYVCFREILVWVLRIIDNKYIMVIYMIFYLWIIKYVFILCIYNGKIKIYICF